MNTLTSVDDAPTSGWARWRWFSQWPVAAMIALVLVMFLSGSRLMGSYRWVQFVIGVVWVVWLLLELALYPYAPPRERWSRRRRIIATGLIILSLVSMLFLFATGNWTF